jgi:hypothetical protein
VLQAFQKRYPAGKFAAQARRLEEQLEWNSIQESENTQTLRTFLSRYPESELATKASARLRELDARAAARQEIRQLLQRYAQAYRRKNIREIAALWPGLPPEASRDIANAFAGSETIEFDLTPLAEPVLSGSSASGVTAATVTCLRRVRTVMRGGERLPAVENRVSIRLQRDESKWTLVSVSVE